MTVSQRIALLLSLPLAAAGSAFGQTDAAPPAPAPAARPTAAAPSTPAPNDQVVKLSEFQVTDTSPNSYVASETMTGSRVNTKIIDLPYSIVNLTKEFFHDYNIEVLDENMTYIGGLTGVGIGGGFNLRGFSSTSMLRDGFYRLGRYGLSNIEEIEVIRGPNAAIYGRSSPGGMINFISLPPEKLTQQTINVDEGNYKQGKGDLNMTGTIGKGDSTYYVLDVDQTSTAYPGEYSQIRNTEDFLAVQHDFSEDSHLKLSAEYFLQIQHAPQAAPAIVSVARSAADIASTPNNNATTTLVGYDLATAEINPYGPNSELNRGSATFTGTYDKQFNDVWSTRFGAYRFAARRWDFNSNTGWGAVTIPVAGSTTPISSTRGSLPSRGEIMEDGGGFQEDVVAHYWMFNHTVENKSLLTVDFNDYYRWDPTWEYASNSDPALVAWNSAAANGLIAGQASGRAVILTPGSFNGKVQLLPTSPLTYFPNRYNTQNLALFAPGGNSITGGPALNGGTLTRRRTSSLGGNLRQQSTLLGGDLILYAGLRTDNVLFSQRDYTVAFNSVGIGPVTAGGYGAANEPGGSVVRRYEHQNKPNAGFSYNLLPKAAGNELRLYGSYSTAYFVDQTSRPAVIASSNYAPFTAKGFDYGVKGTFLNERLTFTFGGYYDKESNVLVTDVIEFPAGSGNFTDVPEQDGFQLVRGWESDISYAVTPDLSMGSSFGEVNAKYTYFGSEYPEAVGRSVSGITPENGSAYIRYSPLHNILTGFTFNALTTYVASTPNASPITGDTFTIVNGVSTLTGSTGGYKLRLPSYALWDFGIQYKLPYGRKWTQTLSLNLDNAFNKFYLKTNALMGDGRNVIFGYTLQHSGY